MITNLDPLTRDYLAARRAGIREVIRQDLIELQARRWNDPMMGEIMLELRDYRRMLRSAHQGHSLSFGGCGTVHCETCKEEIT